MAIASPDIMPWFLHEDPAVVSEIVSDVLLTNPGDLVDLFDQAALSRGSAEDLVRILALGEAVVDHLAELPEGLTEALYR